MIRLGINVPNFGPQTDARALLDWTRFAESHGFAVIVLSDHVAPTREITELYPSPFYDPLTAIAWLAGQTRTVLLATSVLVVPYRHPLLTARVAAMLHEISGGRFALGVGVGWSATEFAAVGADYARRGQVTDQYLQVITTAWRQPRIDADLAGLRITGVATGPNPPGGRVPLWVGGSAGPAIRRAVRFGTAWHPVNPGRTWLAQTGLPAPAPGKRARGRVDARHRAQDQVPARGRRRPPALTGRSASAPSPRSPATSGSSPDWEPT